MAPPAGVRRSAPVARRAPGEGPPARPEPASPGATAPGTSSPAATPPADLIEVGRVVDAWGVQGWVKIEPFNDPADSVLRRVRRCWIDGLRLVTLDKARVHGALILARPRGFEDRDQALSLKGQVLQVSRADFPASAEDEFYWVDLVGCQVINAQAFDFGRVAAVEDFGAHPLLRVQGEHGERLIPFVGQWVLSVDLAARRVLVDWQPDY